MSEKVNIVFSPTAIDLFRLCERRYHYRYNLNKTAPQKSGPLDRGSIVHTACEVYYKNLQNHFRYEACVDAALSATRLKIAESNLDTKDGMQIIDVMEEYFDYWRVEDQNFEIIAVESPFLVEIYDGDDMKVFVDGKIDLLINDKDYINLPVDHKSYEREHELFRMSNQFKCYAWATKSNYVTVDKIGFQKSLKPHEKFRRPKLSYDPIYLEEWRQNIIRVANYYLYCVAENSWPMNETSCDKFNRKCEYYDVCDSTGEEAKVFKLTANFVEGDKSGRVVTILGEKPVTESAETNAEGQK